MDETWLNVSNILNNHEKELIINIMDKRILDFHVDLEDPNLDGSNTALIRGRVAELRDLIDLFKSTMG